MNILRKTIFNLMFYSTILDERVSNLDSLVTGKHLKQTVQTNKVFNLLRSFQFFGNPSEFILNLKIYKILHFILGQNRGSGYYP